MNIAIWLARVAQDAPDRGALFLGDKQVADYRAFDQDVRALGGALKKAGVTPGARVALFMKNTPDYLIAQYAAWYVGAAVVPINAKLHPRECAWILEDSGAESVFASEVFAPGLEEFTSARVVVPGTREWHEMLRASPVADVAQRAPEDMAWLFYTSGTTGRPKGVMISHRMLVAMSLSYQVDCDLVRPTDAALYAAPLSHGAGLYNMMHVRAGARHVFPPSEGFDAREVLDLAAILGGVHMFVAPTMVQRLTRHAVSTGQRGEGLKTIIYAGGPMYTADILEAVDCFGPVFAQIYGQGECPMGITALSRADVTDRAHPRWRERLGSVGRAQSAVEVAVMDDNGEPARLGDVGEIVVRGDLVMPGYWRNPEATAKTIRQGWLWTGDMGEMDADGYVTLKDRSKDLIISGGTNIYPREVEDILLEHADVLEAAVVGRAHPEWGEEVVAFVVLSSDVSPNDLDAHCLTRMARFKRPKEYFAVNALPKNNYGKVLKTELRDRLAASS